MKKLTRFRVYRTLLLLVLTGAVAFLAAAQACVDRDRDNVENGEDNCFMLYNPLQQDEDGDLYGDPCDPETPMHEFTFDRCYKSTITPESGQTYGETQTSLTPDGEGKLAVAQLWPPELYNTVLTGAGQHNGREIWIMTENVNQLNLYAMFNEGTQVAVDAENVVQRIEGSYHMLRCEGCYGDPDYMGQDYTNWTSFSLGAWVAERMPPEYCIVGPGDDDTADDDTADDDTDDDDDDDNDDDETPPAGDDDDDNDGCGC